ncbi:TPA: hypothetical protein ACT2W6_002136 [Legionella pneumophila]
MDNSGRMIGSKAFIYKGLWMLLDCLGCLIGGGGGNRTRYHVFSYFYEILSKTMKNYTNSGL